MTIKTSANERGIGELAEIVDQVGERYRADVQKMFQQVKVAKLAAAAPSPAPQSDEKK